MAVITSVMKQIFSFEKLLTERYKIRKDSISVYKKAMEEQDDDDPMLSARVDGNEIYLYGPIEDDYFINMMKVLYGVDYGISAMSFRKLMKQVGGDFTIRINSPGGRVDEASAIASQLDSLNRDYNIIIDGLCASAATMLLGKDTDVQIARFGEVMIHRTLCFCIGNAPYMREVADRLEKSDVVCAKFYKERMKGKSQKEILALMDEETWMTADEAVEMGLADSIFKRKKPKEKMENKMPTELSSEIANIMSISQILTNSANNRQEAQ